MFHLSEMFLITKEEDHQGHFKVPLYHIWPEKLCFVHTGLNIVPEVSRGNVLKQTAGGYAHSAHTVSGNNAIANLKLCT